ncbi:MAG: DUF3500 domain-containing protein [Pseudomonadota bacterium]
MTDRVSTMKAYSRRQVLKTSKRAAVVAAAAAFVPQTVMAQGASMGDLASRWIASLTEAQTKNALFAFDDPLRAKWNYMLGARFAPGVALENMSQPQKDMAIELLAAGLSRSGFDTASNIMLQQDILRDEWKKGSPDRNRERFSLAIFGTPGPSSPWSWRWEGHHLTITFTLIGDEIISHTPKAFSSEPNTVPSGPHKGLVVLPDNERLGRAVFAELKGAERKKALVSETSVGNITATAGREFRYKMKQGVALGDLTTSQADKLRHLIDVYTKNHLPGALADDQGRRLSAKDLAGVHFAWAGQNRENESIYYRIHGDTFLIEFATLRNQPLHHHTAVHDLEHHLGLYRL